MAALNSNARTSAASVKEVFETDLGDQAMNQHINVAATMVDDIAAADDSVPDQRLELIETYLAAHVASTQDPRVTDASVGESNVSYVGNDDVTEYFQTAASLDPTGTLTSEGTLDVSISVPDGRGVD